MDDARTPVTADDTLLARRLAADLDGAFEALVVAHQDRLYTIALRFLGEPRDAEEVAQDALVRAYRAMAGYGAERIRGLRLRPWLASICLNLCRNRRRRLDERTPPLQLEPLVEAGVEPGASAGGGGGGGAGAGGSPHARAARRETVAELAEALLALPPGPRAAIVLRHVDGLSVAETALALDRPEGTVKAQVSRGLALLRTLLADHPDLSPARRELTA